MELLRQKLIELPTVPCTRTKMKGNDNGSILLSVGTCVFMFSISWRLTLVTLVALPIIVWVSHIYGEYYQVKYTELLTSTPSVVDTVTVWVNYQIHWCHLERTPIWNNNIFVAHLG